MMARQQRSPSIQNPQDPTGEVVITLTDGQVKRLYVTDVKIPEASEDHQMEYVVMDVPQENYLVTIILPFMLSIVVVVIIIMVMEPECGRRRCQCQDDELWQEQGQDEPGQQG
mgnify:CR=1 FL=1